MTTHIPEEVAPHLSLDSIPQSLQFLVPNLVATVLNKANMQHLYPHPVPNNRQLALQVNLNLNSKTWGIMS